MPSISSIRIGSTKLIANTVNLQRKEDLMKITIVET